MLGNSHNFLLPNTLNRHPIASHVRAGYEWVSEFKIWLTFTQPSCTLKMKHHHDADFVVTGGTGGCRNDNLQCHQWWQSWHHNNSQFSILYWILYQVILDLTTIRLSYKIILKESLHGWAIYSVSESPAITRMSYLMNPSLRGEARVWSH